MKVKCIANTGKALSPKNIDGGQIREARFHATIGEIYSVYAICLFDDTLEYLLLTEKTTNPFWYPAELFKVIDPLLPIEWYFSFNGYERDPENPNVLSAVWGYKEIVENNQYYVDLIEREPDALDIFFKRKKEIDEYEELAKFKDRFQ